MKKFSITISALLCASMLVPSALAGFSDISTSLYVDAIIALSERGIVKGNPDGLFHPERTVNRAEFLTMLYRAKNMEPTQPDVSCFSDVPLSAWFAGVVCDSAAKGYVGGYPDKTFKPEKAVNRVEAVKMLFTVLGLSLKASADNNNRALAYTDVSATAWYMLYLPAAFERGILPIAGYAGNMLMPEKELTRGEAAAYIANAIGAKPSQSSSTSSVTSASVSSVQSTTGESNASYSSSPAPLIRQEVDYPFSDSGVFIAKQTVSYTFTLKQAVTTSVKVTGVSALGSGVSCRLYRLDGTTNFSTEYYLGHQYRDACDMTVTLAAGSYQFDIQPVSAGAAYTVFLKTAKGDGNDGFSQAKSLTVGTPKTSALDTTDYADWFTFTLGAQTNTMVEISNDSQVRCIIYPLANVDIYGFAGPDCNAQYDFPPGTYVIGVMQRDERVEKPSFTIRLK